MTVLLLLLWPLFTILGIFLVLFYQGIGLGSPSFGFWLIPLGVVGLLTTSAVKGYGSSLLFMWTAIIWALALFSVFGLYIDYYYELSEGFGALVWVLPIVGLTLIGTVLMLFMVYKLIRQDSTH